MLSQVQKLSWFLWQPCPSSSHFYLQYSAYTQHITNMDRHIIVIISATLSSSTHTNLSWRRRRSLQKLKEKEDGMEDGLGIFSASKASRQQSNHDRLDPCSFIPPSLSSLDDQREYSNFDYRLPLFFCHNGITFSCLAFYCYYCTTVHDITETFS